MINSDLKQRSLGPKSLYFAAIVGREYLGVDKRWGFGGLGIFCFTKPRD